MQDQDNCNNNPDKKKQAADWEKILNKLNTKERALFILMADDNSNGEMAEILFVAKKTVETYKQRIREKLQLGNMAKLNKLAFEYAEFTNRPKL